jgi:hypothetical protein
MRRASVIVLVWILVCAAMGQAQSAGDTPSQGPKKDNAKSPTTRSKVITNDDLTPSPDPATPKSKTSNPEPKPGPDTAAFSRNADRTREAILAEKTKIKDMQVQIEKLRATIHYVETGVPANSNQLQKQQAADRMQEQMELETKKLSGMQEAARHAGFGSVVYDP